jgi:hypothetical protein
MTFMFDRHFTVTEANALIPSVKEVFRHIHALADPAEAVESAQDLAKSKTNGNGKHGPGNGPPALTHYAVVGPDERLESIKKLLDGLQDAGIVIQDVNRGLIDFPTLRDGREVFLCYQLSDGDAITHFHELDAGFAGRRPL